MADRSSGACPDAPGLFVCAGHGAWGISTGPASARLIADEILGRSPRIPAGARPAQVRDPDLPPADRLDRATLSVASPASAYATAASASIASASARAAARLRRGHGAGHVRQKRLDPSRVEPPEVHAFARAKLAGPRGEGAASVPAFRTARIGEASSISATPSWSPRSAKATRADPQHGLGLVGPAAAQQSDAE